MLFCNFFDSKEPSYEVLEKTVPFEEIRVSALRFIIWIVGPEAVLIFLAEKVPPYLLLFAFDNLVPLT